jgi:hypothetical protein
MADPLVRFCTSLLRSFPSLGSVHLAHMKDWGELLPHLFLADLTRHLAAASAHHDPRKDFEIRRLMKFLERAWSEERGEVRGLIITGFLENLPRGDEPGARLRAMLGSQLRRELIAIDGG